MESPLFMRFQVKSLVRAPRFFPRDFPAQKGRENAAQRLAQYLNAEDNRDRCKSTLTEFYDNPMTLVALSYDLDMGQGYGSPNHSSNGPLKGFHILA